MTDPQPAQPARSTLNRRKFLATAGAGVAGGSLLTMLDARQAPAQIKGTTLRILRWSHFIPAYDAWYDKFAKEWGDKTGVKVRVDHIPHLDIPAHGGGVRRRRRPRHPTPGVSLRPVPSSAKARRSLGEASVNPRRILGESSKDLMGIDRLPNR